VTSNSRTQRSTTAARMYYQSGHSTEEIARHLHVSRSTVSRLLTHARERGIVEIRVRGDVDVRSRIERELTECVNGADFHIVEVRDSLSDARISDAVAQYAAQVVTELIEPGTRVGVAWGNTVSNVVGYLRPEPIRDVSVVQLNGAGSHSDLGLSYAADIVTRFAQNFSAAEYLFPVPAFFDHPETKDAMWRERSIRHILALQQSANMLLFSIGGLVGDTVSYIYSAGYLTDGEVEQLRNEGVIGDIATTFYGEDGASDLAINRRSTGPSLDVFKRAEHSVCVASGESKVPGVAAALRLGYITDLVIDAPTATMLAQYLQRGLRGSARHRRASV
jgi:deoxyribonucleoside regulator